MEKKHPKFMFRLRKKRVNWYFQCKTTELELIHSIQKEFLKFLKDSIEGKNIMEQELGLRFVREL